MKTTARALPLFLFATFFICPPTIGADDTIELTKHTSPVCMMRWSADQTQLATACEAGRVCVWDTSGKLISETQISAVKDPVFAFTPDLRRVAVTRRRDDLQRGLVNRNGGETVVYSLPDGRKISQFSARTEPHRDYPFSASIFTIEFSPDGKRLAVGGSVEAVGGRHGGPGGIATVWDVETGQIVRRSTGFSTIVISFAWTKDNEVLVIGTAGSGTELAEAGELHTWHRNNWLPSGSTPVQIFHADFHSPLPVGEPGYADIVGVRQIRIAGDKLVGLIQHANEEVIRTWNLKSGESQSISTSDINWRTRRQLKLSPNGTFIAAYKDGSVQIYDTATMKRITDIDATSSIQSVSFSPNDSKIAIGMIDGTTQIRMTKHGQ